MAAGATYEPIATTTLSATASSYTFSSIPATYTDLRLVSTPLTSTAGQDFWLQFNGITTTTYSQTLIYGDGTSAASTRASNNDGVYFTWTQGVSNTIPQLWTTDIFSYAGSTYKTLLFAESADRNGSGVANRTVGLWRSTAAITSINLKATTLFSVGTTFTLYGIKAA